MSAVKVLGTVKEVVVSVDPRKSLIITVSSQGFAPGIISTNQQAPRKAALDRSLHRIVIGLFDVLNINDIVVVESLEGSQKVSRQSIGAGYSGGQISSRVLVLGQICRAVRNSIDIAKRRQIPALSTYIRKIKNRVKRKFVLYAQVERIILRQFG